MTNQFFSGDSFFLVRCPGDAARNGLQEAVTHLRFSQNIACGFPAVRSSEIFTQHKDGLHRRIKHEDVMHYGESVTSRHAFRPYNYPFSCECNKEPCIENNSPPGASCFAWPRIAVQNGQTQPFFSSSVPGLVKTWPNLCAKSLPITAVLIK